MAIYYDNWKWNVDHYDIVCNKCGIEKHEENFYESNATKVKRVYTCKECWNDFDRSGPRLSSLPDGSDKELAITILNGLGYDIEQNIHQQFLHRVEDKYGIKLR